MTLFKSLNSPTLPFKVVMSTVNNTYIISAACLCTLHKQGIFNFIVLQA